MVPKNNLTTTGTKTMTYQSRLRLYESLKARIAATATNPTEYERRVTALAKRLGI